MQRVALALMTVLLLPVGHAAARDPCVAELRRASQSLAQIYREWPLRSSSDPVHKAVQAIAVQLAQRAGEAGSRNWRVHVVRDSKLNAFSVGDGHIFITEGMLRFVDSEAELAAVLAHEFGHHVVGHFCTPPSPPPKKTGFWSRVFGGGQDESSSSRRQVGSLTALVDPEREQQADRAAVAILKRAGHDPYAAFTLARRMASSAPSAHFQYGHRIEALQSLLGNDTERYHATRNSAAFQDMKRTLGEESASHWNIPQ